MQQAQKLIDNWLHNNDNNEWLILHSLDLETLPPIPNNCLYLNCSHNKLTKLPELPNCIQLICSDNELVTLPELPKCIQLTCNNNKLTVLPELLNCKRLCLSFNQLTYLPRVGKDCWLEHIQTTDETCTCFDFGDNHNNKYMYISNKQLENLVLDGVYKEKINTKINYNNCAKVIQRAFRGYIKRKYFGDILRYLVKGPSGIVWEYAF
jgi:hypothetical protein